MLLRGQKQFSLFSPAEAANLHTRGTIATVHPNGRICYEVLLLHSRLLPRCWLSQLSPLLACILQGNETRADGASPDSLEVRDGGCRCLPLPDSRVHRTPPTHQLPSQPQEYARRSAAEEAVQEAERAVAAGEEGAEERLAAAEDELEEILLGALMVGLGVIIQNGKPLTLTLPHFP